MSKNCSSNQVESDESDHVDWMNAAKLDRRFERFKQKDGSDIMNPTWLTVVTLAAVGVLVSGIIELLLTKALKMAVSKNAERTRKGKSWNLR